MSDAPAKRFWRARSALVTGGAGFLGRWLVDELIRLGARPIVVDRDRKAASALGCPLRVVDLTNAAAVRRLVLAVRPSAVLHLAGQAGLKACQDRPDEAFASNIVCTHNLLEALRLVPCAKSIVAVSSNHVYGHQDRSPIDEDRALNGLSMYAASKICADVLARTYGKSYGLPVAIARITNTYGGRDPHVKHIVTASVLSVLQGRAPVIANSGRDRKGYLYVEDTVRGLLELARAMADKPALRGEAFNIVADEAVTVKQLVNDIIRLSGSKLTPKVLDPDAEAESEHLSNRKARRAFGWRPRFTRRQGLSETLGWYRRRRASR